MPSTVSPSPASHRAAYVAALSSYRALRAMSVSKRLAFALVRVGVKASPLSK